MPDTTYQPLSWIFTSKGIIARWATDRTPDGTYLNLSDAEERQENAMSSRYGSIIINRDPNGTPGGINYFLPNPIITITRLAQKATNSSWRYAGDTTGILWRRAGDAQGPYTQIITGLSGGIFGSVVNTTFGSSTPYIFIADANAMLKDNGTGTPTQWGIAPPAWTANSYVYPPNIYLIDGANNGSVYTLSNCSFFDTGGFSITTPVGAPFSQFSSYLYTPITDPNLKYAFNGCLATFATSTVPTTEYDVTAIQTTDLSIGTYTTLTITTGSATGVMVGNTVQIAGSNNPIFDGYYTVSMVISATQFKVAFTSFTNQSASNAAMYRFTSTARQALLFNVFGEPFRTEFTAIGVYGPINSATTTFPISVYEFTVAANTTGSFGITGNFELSHDNWATDDDLIVINLGIDGSITGVTVAVQFDVNNSGYTTGYFSQDITVPSTATSAGVLSYYLRMGAFQKFGNAGQDNWTWSDVTGWRVLVTNTNTTTAVSLFFNGLYQQWGYGPSSFGGVGYDYRYTYYNAVTKTESNGSPIQAFDTQFGTMASLSPPIALRQAIQVVGNYSPDPQVNFIRIYRHGGTLSENWLLVDAIPNIPAQGPFNTFAYQDTTPDADLQQANTLALDNDAPVTSTLPNPVLATLTEATTFPGAGDNPWDGFNDQQIFSTAGFGFIVGQVIDIGTPQNLEQVRVTQIITTGPPHDQGVYAVVRLKHNAGEPVQAFSIPQQPCDLCALAYGQMWVAGDPNNPHFLYYSKPGYPENFGPQNYIPVSQPSDPIMAVINFRGTLFVATLTTWYQIVGGASPYAQPTGSKHGLVAKGGWTQTESAIWYQAIDGIRAFRGADGMYMTLIIEWLYRQVPQAYTPIPLANLSNLGAVQLAFQNNYVYVMYQSYDSNNYRIAFSTEYQRWRNDTVHATAMYFEEDTNILLYAKYIVAGAQSGYAICQDRVNDYDDGGWSGGALQQVAIASDIRVPYQDLGKPHFPKQWNTLEVDVDTQSQNMTVLLHVDDDAQILNLGTINTPSRQKVQLKINAGDGVQGYKVSPEFQISSKVAPNIYQLDIYYALLAAYRTSFDTYWHKFGTDESKLVKEGYFDYTSTSAITVMLFADGGTSPYYTFVLPANPARQSEPVRVRFAPIKLRMFRCIAVASEPFQLWADPVIRWKETRVGTGYATLPLVT